MEIDWKSVKRILIVRLRSIGDTVLSTPSLLVLREYLPDAQIDILLEDWVAPVLEGFGSIDEVLTVSSSFSERLAAAKKIRERRYDAVFNFHGGTTSGFFVRASGARFRIGNRGYRFPYFYTHICGPAAEFWGRAKTHSAEQQLALLGFSGIPVKDCPKTRLSVVAGASDRIDQRLQSIFRGNRQPRFALIHPSAAYETKRWAASGFASAIEHLKSNAMESVIITTQSETNLVKEIEVACGRQLPSLSDLTLPEVTALASKASLFLGNDSGIAHIAAAVKTPSVVVFGSSNISHWSPWTDAPHRVVFNHFDCQPCPGDYCRVFEEPQCILSVDARQVVKAVDELI